jgi:hypothetical protein
VLGNVNDSCLEKSAAADDQTCDGVDDDCNGATDEDYPNPASTCGTGACANTGTKTCVLGNVNDSCLEKSAAADDQTCDGVDDDCNGATDEDYPNPASSCGTGACANTGTKTCVLGNVNDSCLEKSAAADDQTCDGVDDDCNGATDEDYPNPASSCGTGACANTGTKTCVLGNVNDSCLEKSAAADDQTCDGVDDDCNGATDEDYPNPASTCGTGACANTGTKTCVLGNVNDSCLEKSAAADDQTCDGVDDDCNGATDEDYPNPASSCGTGACANTGTKTCVLGNVNDSCLEKSAAADDQTCDGVDDDCNGATDEDYPNPASSCGTGACANTGTKTCVLGNVNDSCLEKSAAADDQTCDGVDDDCNGATDEDYPNPPSTCGVGPCANTGTKTCVNGNVQDGCVALDPPENPEQSCDNVDNDCDGKTDGADSDIDVGECCAGNAGQMGVDPERSCPSGWFCDQSWDTMDGKASEYERKCYNFGEVGGFTGECSPYDCGKDDGFATVNGALVTYSWCEIFKDLAILGVSADHINAACGWSTNGVFTSNHPRSGNGSPGANEWDGGYCSCNPLCETFSSSLPCCSNLFATGAKSGLSVYGGFNCGKTHINNSTLPAFSDPHYTGARCRHTVECLGVMTCTQPGTYADGVPVPAATDGICL